MNELGNLWNTSLKKSESVRIGHHHSGNLRALLSYQALQILEIHLTIGQRLHLYNLQATYCGRGRIGAMGTIGHNHLFARHITTLAMVVIDSHQSHQLTMSTCIGLKGEVSQTCECTERLLQQSYQSLCTTYRFSRLFWVQILELGQSSHLLVDFGIVLHGT